MMKRILTVFLTAVLCMAAFPKMDVNALVFTPNCIVTSESAVLLNMDTNTIVYEKNADMKQTPAALAQIMTAVIVLENCEDISGVNITATEEMFAPFDEYENPTDLRYADISADDTLSVEALLYAMMLTSSCEASVMLANHFGDGSEDAFVEKMNAKAAEIGMKDTRFTNATGLYSARQLTTAHDLMKLLQYAMKVPRFETIACAIDYTAAGKEEWHWVHSNTMTDEDDPYYCVGVRGIKTGNLQEAGRNICCKASRDGNNYLLVCLKSPLYDENEEQHFYHLEDARNIVNWAYDHLTYQDLLTENDEITEIEVKNAEGSNYVIVKPSAGYSCIWSDVTSMESIQRIITVEEDVQAPVHVGDKLGTIQLKFSGETLASMDLLAASNVERNFWKYNLSIIPDYFGSGYLTGSLKIALVLTIIYFILCIIFFIRYKQQRKRRKQAANMKKGN